VAVQEDKKLNSDRHVGMYEPCSVYLFYQDANRGLYQVDDGSGFLHGYSGPLPDQLRQQPSSRIIAEAQVNAVRIDFVLMGNVPFVAQRVNRARDTSCTDAQSLWDLRVTLTSLR
jgi:hypothetical protein